jgi:hypothetical protein
MGLLGHLARPLTPKSGAKAIVFLGRDNGFLGNAALDVRSGSKADLSVPNSDVGFSPMSGHHQLGPACPKSARRRHLLNERRAN